MIKLSELIGKCNECGRDWNHGHDHEAGMAKNEIRDMISNASKIDNMIGEEDNLPGWVSAYISLAADYMHSVSEYLAGESSREEEPGPGYSINESQEPEVKPPYRVLYMRSKLDEAWQKGKRRQPLDERAEAEAIITDLFGTTEWKM